jgi:transcriptional regulator with XRE-family HTH domain
LSPTEVARRSGHDVHHILKMFESGGPTPTLRIYLDLLEAAGACFAGVKVNKVPAVLAHINALRRRGDLKIAEFAKRAGMKRPHLSRICNGKQGIGIECFDSLVTALGAEEDMRLVARDPEQRPSSDLPTETESPATADVESKQPADGAAASSHARPKKRKKSAPDRAASGLATDPEQRRESAGQAAELAAMIKTRDELLRELNAEREQRKKAAEELAQVIKERDDVKAQLIAEREQSATALKEINASLSSSEAELQHERETCEVMRLQLDVLREHIRNRDADVINTLQNLTRADGK